MGIKLQGLLLDYAWLVKQNLGAKRYDEKRIEGTEQGTGGGLVPSKYTILEFSSTDEENHNNPQTTRCGSSESNPAASER